MKISISLKAQHLANMYHRWCLCKTVLDRLSEVRVGVWMCSPYSVIYTLVESQAHLGFHSSEIVYFTIPNQTQFTHNAVTQADCVYVCRGGRIDLDRCHIWFTVIHDRSGVGLLWLSWVSEEHDRLTCNINIFTYVHTDAHTSSRLHKKVTSVNLSVLGLPAKC